MNEHNLFYDLKQHAFGGFLEASQVQDSSWLPDRPKQRLQTRVHHSRKILPYNLL